MLYEVITGQEGNARVTFTPRPGDGDYYLMVRGYDSDVLGSYDLNFRSLVVQLDSYEPDNSLQEAGRLEMNRPQDHTLVVTDEVDWFRFQLSGPQNITVETRGDLDTYLTLYDSQGNLLEESDDDGSDYRNNFV